MADYNRDLFQGINTPEYCMFFIKKILDGIETGIKNDDDSMDITVYTKLSKHPYCYDAVNLVQKTFRRKGYHIQLKRFKMDATHEKDANVLYSWNIKKDTPIDDLPF